MNRNIGLYHFLSRLFAGELDENTLFLVREVRFPEAAPWEAAGRRWNEAVSALTAADLDALAVDYARVFLGAGLAQAAAAFPYESVYTSPKGIIMQDAWSRMRELLREKKLEIAVSSADLMEDHISVELEYMAALETAAEQAEFLRLHLQNWIPRFCGDVERYAQTELYRASAGLLRAFVENDAEFLAEESAEAPSESSGSTVPAAPGSAQGKSFALSSAELELTLQALKRDYDIYGPALDDKGKVRFRKLDRVSEIVNDRQSDFSPKEVYYPISQTLFRFDENRYETVLPEQAKPILIFAHPCDINAIRRLDNIFLKNGGQADVYYEILRSKVKFALLECPESGYSGCWCVSMGSNRTEDYALALRLGETGADVLVNDELLLPAFDGAKDCDYAPRFVDKNEREAHLPRVGEVKSLQTVFDLEFWKGYNDRCISCGGCNTVCPTCSCYETADYLDQENSRKGERRRVWASCMIPEFTRTTGGHVARPNPEKLMRFKALHKVFDYNTRFGGREHMCVGCGRCVLRCPEEIDFLDTVNRLHDEVERLIALQEAET